MTKIVLVAGVYADRKVREGVVLRITTATNYPVEVAFDDGLVGYINFEDYDFIPDVDVIEIVEDATPEGMQLVIPGCEKIQAAGPAQMVLF